MKQMEEKKALTVGKRVADRDNFNAIGIRSSDIYYINEDKKAAATAALKGGARAVADKLRSDHMSFIDERKKKREQEAINRQ